MMSPGMRIMAGLAESIGGGGGVRRYQQSLHIFRALREFSGFLGSLNTIQSSAIVLKRARDIEKM